MRTNEFQPSGPAAEFGESGESGAPFELVDGRFDCGFLLICDHARAEIPAEYRNLGLPPSEFSRHIAYDIGVRGVTLEIARLTGAPAVLSCFSRLLIDPNRGTDDPTLVMKIADGSIVPGNAHADDADVSRRIARFHAPYHDAIDAAIDQAIAGGVPPAILSIHSFTPRLKKIARPWHATVLWDCDPRLPVPLIRALERESDIMTGENVPYTGRLHGDTLYRHGTRRGLAHALIEIRQDLIAGEDGQKAWAARLARIIGDLASTPELNEIQYFGAEANARPNEESDNDPRFAHP